MDLGTAMAWAIALLFLLGEPLVDAITMSELDFDVGHMLFYSVRGKSSNLDKPYHYMVALSPTEAFDIRQADASNRSCRPRILSKFNVPEGIKHHLMGKRPVDNDQTIGYAKTIILAKRMEGLTLPYDPMSCNCHHFANYILYGRTRSKTFSLFHRPPGDECPLDVVITKETNVLSPDFELRSGDGLPYKLKTLTEDDYQWIDERITRLGYPPLRPGSQARTRTAAATATAPSRATSQRRPAPTPAASPSPTGNYGGYGRSQSFTAQPYYPSQARNQPQAYATNQAPYQQPYPYPAYYGQGQGYSAGQPSPPRQPTWGSYSASGSSSGLMDVTETDPAYIAWVRSKQHSSRPPYH